MNLESFTLQDLELILSQSNCSCHFINPNKTRIILWKEVKDGVETYYLRLGIQKFVSYPLSDKNQALYWRFKDYSKEIKEFALSKEAVKQSDPITKFQQRQAKTEQINHESNNRSEQSESVSQ